MANSKNVKQVVNKGKKVAKKIKKSKHKGLLAIAFIIVLAACVFFGFEYFQESNNYTDFVNTMDSIKSELDIPTSTKSDLLLLNNSDDISISWSSSDEKVISNTGKVSQPTYSEGDKRIKLYATCSYTPKTFLYDFIASSLGSKNYTINFIVNVECKEASDIEIVNEVINKIDLPSEVDSNIGLTKKAYKDDLTITYTSSNDSILSSDGIYNAPIDDTSITFTCNVKLNDASVSKEFNIKVLKDSITSTECNDDFDSLDENNNYKEIKTNIITYTNAKIVADPNFVLEDETETNSASNYMRLRSQEGNMAYFTTSSIDNVSNISFDYKFDGSQKTESTTLDIYLNDSLVDSITVLHKDEFTSVNCAIDGSGVIKVIHNSSFKETFILIDNVKITSSISIDDIANLVKLENNLNKSIVLPATTSIGGLITWTSSDINVMTNDGILLVKPENATNVTLTANISYKGNNKTLTFEVTLKEAKTSDPLKIYFIDIGETDLGDTGESILITYNSIDILVDAGDQKDSTYNAVKNAINEYSSDKILDYVIATHPDSDHIGNMANVFNDFQVNNLVKFSGESFTTKKFLNLKAAYDAEPNCNIYDIKEIVSDNDTENDYIYLSSEIYIKFLDTKHYEDSETNGRSIVFLLYAYGTKVLMTGDADNLSPHSDLEASYQDQVGDVDILKVVHHGTANGCSTSYLSAIKPEYAIICNGNYLGNKHGHPHPTAISNLSACQTIEHIYAITGGGLHCELTSTGAFKGQTTLEESKVDRNGTIILTIDNNDYSFEASLTGDSLIDLRDTTYWTSYQSLNK